ncbi:MAG: type II toxin-antitoxin system YafQ family toxin [Oscillospiraceae bacterium]
MVTRPFVSDYLKVKILGYNLQLLNQTVEKLLSKEILPKEQLLQGNWDGHKQCEISDDWLLIYKVKFERCLLLVATGTRRELFG